MPLQDLTFDTASTPVSHDRLWHLHPHKTLWSKWDRLRESQVTNGSMALSGYAVARGCSAAASSYLASMTGIGIFPVCSNTTMAFSTSWIAWLWGYFHTGRDQERTKTWEISKCKNLAPTCCSLLPWVSGHLEVKGEMGPKQPGTITNPPSPALWAHMGPRVCSAPKASAILLTPLAQAISLPLLCCSSRRGGRLPDEPE